MRGHGRELPAPHHRATKKRGRKGGLIISSQSSVHFSIDAEGSDVYKFTYDQLGNEIICYTLPMFTLETINMLLLMRPKKAMNLKFSALSAVTARSICAAICLLSLGGCFGNYQLVTFKPSTYISGWHQYETPRSPNNPIEEAVVQVARTQHNSEKEGSDIFFIVNDYSKVIPVQIIDVVAKSTSTHPFPEKTVTRYRIIGEKISAMSDTADEFYVDPDFERAILRAVAKTWASERVILYTYGDKTVSIMSQAVNNCTADVKVFGMTLTNQAPLAEKRVAFCFKD
ncbi:MAG: hypothetical protein ABSA86_02970 [Oryzomonas sp.]|jgi:hypothetical protein